nr:hypothetical protein [Paraburkholderia sp. LEh10]
MSEGVAVRVLHVVLEGREVGVGVEVNDVQLLVEGAEDGVGDRMVAAQRNGQRAAFDDGARHLRDVLERALDVGRMNIDVADIRDQPLAHFLDEILRARARIVIAAVARAETQRVLAQRARRHARTGEERRAFVERDAEHGDGRIERREVFADARAQKGRNADEWPVDSLHDGTAPLT